MRTRAEHPTQFHQEKCPPECKPRQRVRHNCADADTIPRDHRQLDSSTGAITGPVAMCTEERDAVSSRAARRTKIKSTSAATTVPVSRGPRQLVRTIGCIPGVGDNSYGTRGDVRDPRGATRTRHDAYHQLSKYKCDCDSASVTRTPAARGSHWSDLKS